MEFPAIPQPPLEEADRFQGADLVLGILGAGTNGHRAGAAAMLRDALEKLPHPARGVLVVNDGAAVPRVEDELAVPVLLCALTDPSVSQIPYVAAGAYQTILSVSGRIGARACAVIAADLETVNAQWVDRLVRPALEMEFDLVTPRYARHKWEGMLNRSILAPLCRSLYGKRAQNPMGPDLGLSGNLTRAILDDPAGARRAGTGYPVASIVAAAVRGSFQMCEAHLGQRHHPPADWMNLSSLLAEVLGPVFLDMEWNAALWQRVRGSQPLPVQGSPEAAPQETGPVDVQRLIDSFQLGAGNLSDVWSLVLPPKSLLEIRKLARSPAGQFRMSDDLWASVVYDFALAHRVRNMNRDHLLRSFTPLYLGWIASYALEMEAATPPAVEARLERLARAYETGKPYLVSRWRWPDRFNP